MKISHLLAATLWFLLIAGCDSAGPERPIGAATIELHNASTTRRFPVEVWYESARGAPSEELWIRPPLRPLVVSRGAVPRAGTGKRALVVLSHGNWGSRYSLGWLARDLVNAGYVVLSTSHPGTGGEDQTAAGRYRLWDRSTDVTFALDQILRHPTWGPLIDERRIGFVGHSFGGWTGVSLAGGIYDPIRQRAFCERVVKKDAYCEGTIKDDVSGVPAAGVGALFRDARIKAFYIMASGPAQGFSEDSLRSIDVPFMIDTAEFDEILEARSNSSALAALVPGAKEIKRAVGHFTYVPECRWVVGPILANFAGVPICDDPDSVDRAAAHRQIARDVIRFLDAQVPPAAR